MTITRTDWRLVYRHWRKVEAAYGTPQPGRRILAATHAMRALRRDEPPSRRRGHALAWLGIAGRARRERCDYWRSEWRHCMERSRAQRSAVPSLP